MQFFRHFLLAVFILYLVTPEIEGGWFKRTFKKIGRGIKKGIKKIGGAVKGVVKKIKKAGCKVLFSVICPAGVTAAGGIIGAGTSGVGAALVSAGVAAGVSACHVRKNKCKRSIDDSMQFMEVYPFSDEFTDYDINDDKEIEYEEFAFAVMKEFPMGDPEELIEPFIWADANGDGRVDTDEFKGAPWLFGHYEHEVATAA